MPDEPLDLQAVHDELERVRGQFHRLLDGASAADLHRRSRGTRWTNEELLFHMLFGYLIVRTLRPLLELFARLPPAAGRAYARLLDASTGPFDAVNYAGAVVGSRIYGRRRMGAEMDRTIAALQRSLERETEASLARGMSFPTRWDPFFRDRMTRADLYRYAAEHFDFHRAQLTLGRRN